MLLIVIIINSKSLILVNLFLGLILYLLGNGAGSTFSGQMFNAQFPRALGHQTLCNGHVSLTTGSVKLSARLAVRIGILHKVTSAWSRSTASERACAHVAKIGHRHRLIRHGYIIKHIVHVLLVLLLHLIEHIIRHRVGHPLRTTMFIGRHLKLIFI